MHLKSQNKSTRPQIPRFVAPPSKHSPRPSPKASPNTSQLRSPLSSNQKSPGLYVSPLKSRKYEPLSKNVRSSPGVSPSKVLETSRSSASIKSGRSLMQPVCLPRDKSPPVCYPRESTPKTSDLVHLEIQGLKPNADDFYVKGLCRGVHVVSLNTSINNFTGICEGSAKLTIRMSNSKALDQLRLQVAREGLYIKEQAAVKGRMNSYVGVANRKCLDVHARTPEPKNRFKETCRPHLMSSDDLFGSSPGVGRTLSCVGVKDKILNESIFSWDKVRKTQTNVKTSTPVNPKASFMKKTISSCNKSGFF